MSPGGGYARATASTGARPVGDNDRSAYILAGLMVVTFIFFTMGVIALAFWF